MKRMKKLIALILAVCIVVPGVPGTYNDMKTVRAEENVSYDNTLTWDQMVENLKENAEFVKEFEGNDQIFNGTRTVDASESAKAVHAVNTGSIILRFKANDINSHRVILGTKDSSITMSALDTTNEDSSTFYLNSSNARFRFAYKHTRAELGGPYSFTDGNWHCIVLSSTTGTKTMRLTIDGQELWSNTVESNRGLFAKQGVLDQVTIGGQVNPDGSILGGFFGSISEVIVTSEEISDDAAEAISAAGYSGDIEMGTDFVEMFDASYRDNTWVFTGGEAVQGGFDQTRGVRNYIGQFEEYVRWTLGGSSPINGRQRFAFNTGKAGRTLSDVLNHYETLVADLETKAAGYMVGVEDFAYYEGDMDQFKADLKLFIDKSLALKANNNGFVVIQKPFAVNDNELNATIQAYCDAVDAVVETYKTDTAKCAHIVVVDHFTATDNAEFKENKLQQDGKLNAQGHFEIGKQLVEATYGSSNNYPGTGVTLNRVEMKQPEVYLDVQPVVTATTSSLEVTIPAGNGTEWKYELDMEGTIVSGNATSNSFEIVDLVEGSSYVLKIQSQDGKKQLVTTKGTITNGDNAVKNTPVLDEKQQKIVDLANGEKPLTWLFMGDSITHASLYTRGYDGIAQIFEKYIKEEFGRADDLVLNTAVCNANTDTTLQELDQRLEKFTPDVVSIMLGTNDMSSNVAITADEYKANMQTILNKILEINKDAVIILRSPTPVWDANRVPYKDSYISKLEELVEEYDTIYVDQYTTLDEATTTYASWLKGSLFPDALHPDANGHRIMANQFIKACGLWTEDSVMTNLFYDLGIAEESQNLTPEVLISANQIGIAVEKLEEDSNLQIGDIILKATSKESGQSYEVSVKDSESYAVLQNLPGETTYDVTVSGYLKNTAKKVNFTSQEVTLSDDTEPAFDIILSNKKAIDFTVGAVVGTLSVDGLIAEGIYTFELCEGVEDNALFEIVDNQLKIKETLETGQTYQIRVKAVNGAVSKEETFEIYAVGKQLIFEKANQTITSESPVDLSGESYAEKLFAMEEGTIIVKYTSTSNNGVQTLFSIANGKSGNNNRHFHVYVTPAGRLGCEIRNDTGLNYHIYADGVVSTGVENTVALKADQENKQYKLFANGELVATVNADTLGGFKFADDVTGTDTIQLGATKRGGSAAYTFGGTIHDIKVYGVALSDEEILEAVKVEEAPEVVLLKAGSISVNEENVTEGQPFAAGTADSAKFRIPAFIKLKNGELLAAADARWTGGADWGGLDTIASVSSDNGKTWYYSFPIYFPDSNTIYPGPEVATTVIDPVIVQGADGTIYCIADVNPSGITTGDIMPSTGTGYVKINGIWRLALTGTYTKPIEGNQASYGNPENYEYYVGDFNEDGYAPVLNKADGSPTRWGVDEWYNIYTVNAAGKYEATLTQRMVNDSTVIQQNAFYKDSVLHVFNTGYLWMVTSTDNGRTWGNPQILNTQIKRQGEIALLASPGQGITTSNGDIVIPFYDHGDGMENASVIWSSDNGATWTRSNDVSGMWSSESEVVELNNGVLRMFFRNGVGKISYSDITKVDGQWVMGAGVQTDIPVCSTCNVTAIRHSQTIDGKMVVMVACPGGSGRANGKVFTFLVDEDNTMELYNTYAVNEGYYAYSCMTELTNGNIGLLWEDEGTSIRYDEIAFREVVGLDKSITIDIGQIYVEEKATDAEAALEITTEPNKEVATIKSELVVEQSVTVLHDYERGVTSSLDSFSNKAGLNGVEDAEFTFKASGEYWNIYNGSSYIKLTNAANYFGTKTDLKVEKMEDETFRIMLPGDNRYAIFFKQNMVFDAYSTTDVAGAMNGNSNLDFDLVLLEKQDTISESDVIPGYTRATEIKDGGVYLICHIWDDGSVIVLYPTNGQTSQTKLVGDTVNVKKNVITITGIAAGETSAVVGDVNYNITVLDPMENPAYAGRDIPVSVLNVTAGNSQNGEGPERVLDGNVDTLWHTNWNGSDIGVQYIQFELREEYLVDGLRYLPRSGAGNGTITEYKILVSDDGVNFTEIKEDTWERTSAWKKVSFEGINAKYIRLQTVSAYSDSGKSFSSAAEIRLTGEVVTDEKPVVTPADKTALVAAIAEAEELSADDYTTDSWNTFTAALDAAKEVNANVNATQEAVNTALASLTAAQEALEEKTEGPVIGNIAPGKAVTVSGTSNFVPGHVNDEDTNTRWDSDLIKSGQGANASDIGDAWIYIDLGADVRYEISQIVVRFYNLVYPTSWVIQVSDDATNWDDVTDVLTKENAGPAHPVETIDFETPFTGRYVRLYFNTLNTAAAGHGVGITEFEVYGTELDEQPPVDPVEPVNPFEDVYDTDYYYDPVMWAVEQGITDGWTPTLFAPEMGCTRGQVVTFLWRAAGEPKAKNAENPFTDVAENAYYYDAVLWAVEEGITDGWTKDSFAPDMTCTRGQIVTFIWRAAGEVEVTAENPFADVAENAYYYDAVLWAVEEGITDGWTPTEFAPEMDCTRGQIVTFLYRYYN